MTGRSVKVRVREGAVLYDEGRAYGGGQELTVTEEEAKTLREAGTVEPDQTAAATKPRPRSVVKVSRKKG